MVKPFQFAKTPAITFGSGRIAELPDILKTFGNYLILVTGKNSFMSSGYKDILLKSFDDKEIIYSHVGISGEPSPDIIDSIVREHNSKEIKLVVSIGGGSVIDAGKAVSAMMYKSVSVREYLEGVGTKEHPGSKLPFIAVPTTSGTGSEATKNAVLSVVGKNGFKKSLRHDNLVPDIAIVDPCLTVSCPADITAASGMDCFTQLTESYLSVKANEYTDALAFQGLIAIKSSLARSFKDGEDLEARTGMSFAALTSGICLANAGLGAVHGFASSIGALYNIPHGIICGTLMAPANEINVRELRKTRISQDSLNKYASLGKIFIKDQGRNDAFYIDRFVDYLYQLTDDLKLPKLRFLGLVENDVKLICENTENKNNPVKLASEDLEEIILMRF